MLRGLYTAATGMLTETQRTNVIANNLANVNTAGYKKDETVQTDFEQALLKRINDDQPVKNVGNLGHGSVIDEIATIHEQGSMEFTYQDYDLCINGTGYLAVQTNNGVRYTRNGAFLRSSEGNLVTLDGQNVLDQNNQPVRLPDGVKVVFGSKGQIMVDGQQVGQLQFVQFTDDNRLSKIGNNLYQAADNEPTTPATGTITQGALEKSNVNVVSEMVKLINAYRAYEANSKAVVSQDSLLDKAVNQVGTV